MQTAIIPGYNGTWYIPYKNNNVSKIAIKLNTAQPGHILQLIMYGQHM
jgi:hypothetical protein